MAATSGCRPAHVRADALAGLGHAGIDDGRLQPVLLDWVGHSSPPLSLGVRPGLTNANVIASPGQPLTFIGA